MMTSHVKPIMHVVAGPYLALDGRVRLGTCLNCEHTLDVRLPLSDR